MKLYYLWDEKFEALKNNFISSVKDPFELHSIQIPTPQFGQNVHHEKMWAGGPVVWKSKVRTVLDAIESSTDNEVFVLSDIDIKFYNPVLTTIDDLINNQDMLFLPELASGISPYCGGNINFGFNVIRCNERTRKFFNDVFDELCRTDVLEQKIINQYLYNPNNYQLKWSLLPITFLSTTVGIDRITKELHLFHANCCLTVEQKLELMQQATNMYFKKTNIGI